MDYNDNYLYENSRYIENPQSLSNGRIYLNDQHTQQPTGGLSIASMVVGILSMTCCCFIGGLLGAIGVVFALVALAKKHRYNGMAITGLVTSLVGIVLNVLIIIYLAFIFRTTEAILSDTFPWSNYSDDFNRYYRSYDFDDFNIPDAFEQSPDRL